MFPCRCILLRRELRSGVLQLHLQDGGLVKGDRWESFREEQRA